MSNCLGSAWKILGASPDVTSPDVIDSKEKIKLEAVWFFEAKDLVDQKKII